MLNFQKKNKKLYENFKFQLKHQQKLSGLFWHSQLRMKLHTHDLIHFANNHARPKLIKVKRTVINYNISLHDDMTPNI